ncbi:MAG: serine hydrolase, partial [Chloroflexota bacterium]
FTALGIGKLISQNRLTLDTKMSALDSAFHTFIDPEATILQLLTHTSGIFDYYDEEVIEDFDNFFVDIPWYNLASPSDYWPLFEGQPMKFVPGTRFSYSNGGYTFLSLLIERLSNCPFHTFIADEILTPAGMNDSGFFAFNVLPLNTAYGYLADRQTTNIFNLPIRGAGDGGMYTTVLDMQTFWTSLFADQILGKELTQTFLDTHHPFDDVMGYGCGIYKYLDNRCYFIEGSDAGVEFLSRFYPNSQHTITIISNVTDGNHQIDQQIQTLLNLG